MNKEEIEKDKRGHNTCVKCGKKLRYTTYKDENGEVVGWVTECIPCGLTYDEE